MNPSTAPEDLASWALAALGLGTMEARLDLVAGDASNRRYFRLSTGQGSYVVAHAPPQTEKNHAFLAVRELLAEAGVPVPAVLAADLERGYLLLQDLGDTSLLERLSPSTVDGHYIHALGLLRRMALAPAGAYTPGAYDRALLGEELGRFSQWFVGELLGYRPAIGEQSLIDALAGRLIDSALEQPTVLVHRDFHSRNLMVSPDGDLAVIDFQDAVIGPITYDLVSLLRDCYIRWPAGQVRGWALSHRDTLLRDGLLGGVDEDTFLRWFDWIGLQRHIKVLGTFARLYLRDGKPAYLDDLPLVLEYVDSVLAAYPGESEFAEFRAWFHSALTPVIERQPWSKRL